MTTTIIAAIATLFILSFVIFLILASRAPRGWEDETGYHKGNPYEGDK